MKKKIFFFNRRRVKKIFLEAIERLRIEEEEEKKLKIINLLIPKKFIRYL